MKQIRLQSFDVAETADESSGFSPVTRTGIEALAQ